MFSFFFVLSGTQRNMLSGRNRCKKNLHKQAKTKEEVEKQVHRSEEIWKQRDWKTRLIKIRKAQEDDGRQVGRRADEQTRCLSGEWRKNCTRREKQITRQDDQQVQEIFTPPKEKRKKETQVTLSHRQGAKMSTFKTQELQISRKKEAMWKKDKISQGDRRVLH